MPDPTSPPAGGGERRDPGDVARWDADSNTTCAQLFDLDPGSVRQARAFTARLLDGWGIASDEIVQVVGELAAEVVRGRPSNGSSTLDAPEPPPDDVGSFSVALIRVEQGVRAEVRDDKLCTPFTDCSGLYAPGVRAARIVRRLATCSGCALVRGGRTLWAEVPARRAA